MKGKSLSGIKPLSDNESIGSVTKRFNKMVEEKEGVIREYKKCLTHQKISRTDISFNRLRTGLSVIFRA